VTAGQSMVVFGLALAVYFFWLANK